MAPGERDQPGAPEENDIGDEFIRNAHYDIDSVPEIPLPLNRDNSLEPDTKNLFRALLINQHNLINNCEWLHARLADLAAIIETLKSQLDAHN